MSTVTFRSGHAQRTSSRVPQGSRSPGAGEGTCGQGWQPGVELRPLPAQPLGGGLHRVAAERVAPSLLRRRPKFVNSSLCGPSNVASAGLRTVLATADSAKALRAIPRVTLQSSTVWGVFGQPAARESRTCADRAAEWRIMRCLAPGRSTKLGSRSGLPLALARYSSACAGRRTPRRASIRSTGTTRRRRASSAALKVRSAKTRAT